VSECGSGGCACGKAFDVAAMPSRQRRGPWQVPAINATTFEMLLAA
jgi:hypothetical protein